MDHSKRTADELTARQEVVLAALSAGLGAYTPIQVQKLFFLLDERVFEEKLFSFYPYDYGPFDGAVYEELDALNDAGLLQIGSDHFSVRSYTLTVDGHLAGRQLLDDLQEDVEYMKTLARWVQRQSFSQLVTSIYRAFPEMAVRSVFVPEP